MLVKAASEVLYSFQDNGGLGIEEFCAPVYVAFILLSVTILLTTLF